MGLDRAREAAVLEPLTLGARDALLLGCDVRHGYEDPEVGRRTRIGDMTENSMHGAARGARAGPARVRRRRPRRAAAGSARALRPLDRVVPGRPSAGGARRSPRASRSWSRRIGTPSPRAPSSATRRSRWTPRPSWRFRRRAPRRPSSHPSSTAQGRIGRSTAFFSIATALSRVAGLVREIVAASYFGVTGPMSAFTIAFQVPNLVRSLFADAAIQAAFVPVFTEQLEKGNKREAFRLASHADLPGDAGRWGRSRRSSSCRAADRADLRPRLRGRAARPHGHALASSSSRS